MFFDRSTTLKLKGGNHFKQVSLKFTDKKNEKSKINGKFVLADGSEIEVTLKGRKVRP